MKIFRRPKVKILRCMSLDHKFNSQELKTEIVNEKKFQMKILSSNIRHLEFLDFYEQHLKSREQNDFVRDQLISLSDLKLNIRTKVYTQLISNKS